jgi:4-amino-4-deoxy-L-arabinose transferase-like glycosyltransferase
VSAEPEASVPISSRRHLLLVVALATAVATAGITTIPFYTRGEPREALVVRAMVDGDGWILPLRNGELPRKPPLFHWLGAMAGLALGRVDELTARLPSAVASVVAVVLVFSWASGSGGPTTGALAAVITATSFEWMRASTVARVDMVYTSLLAAALLAADRLLRETRHATEWRWVFWGATAAATLTKGPIGLVLPLLSALAAGWALHGRAAWQRLRPALGVVGVGTIVGVWLLLAIREHGAPLAAIVWRENIHHLIATDVGGTGHAHGAPYLLGVAALSFLPWTPLLPLVAVAVRWRFDDPSVKLATVWTAVVFGVHLIASAKRSVYLLPALPALALLIVVGWQASGADGADSADGVDRVDRVDNVAGAGWVGRLLVWAGRGYAAVGICIGVALLTLAWGFEVPRSVLTLLHERDRLGVGAATVAARRQVLPLTLAATGLLAIVPIVLRAARERRLRRMIATIAVATATGAVVFNTVIHPELAHRRSLKAFMRSVSAVVHEDDALSFLGSADPGAVFYSGREIPRVPRRATTLPAGYLLVWERDWRELTLHGRLPDPLKVSETALPRRGHLLLARIAHGVP